MKKLNEDSLFQIALPETIHENYQLPDPALLQIYRDRNSRVIWMLGEVGDEAYDWVDFILDVNREDKEIPVEQRKPIKCIIANYGGGVDEARMLAEIIRLSKTPVWGIAIGPVCSAASMIYLACHKKFATANANWLFHRGSCSNLEGTYDQINAFMDNYRKEIAELTEFYKQHTSFSPQLIEEKLNGGDWYIYLDEALANGIVDAQVDDIDIFY